MNRMDMAPLSHFGLLLKGASICFDLFRFFVAKFDCPVFFTSESILIKHNVYKYHWKMFWTCTCLLLRAVWWKVCLPISQNEMLWWLQLQIVILRPVNQCWSFLHHREFCPLCCDKSISKWWDPFRKVGSHLLLFKTQKFRTFYLDKLVFFFSSENLPCACDKQTVKCIKIMERVPQLISVLALICHGVMDEMLFTISVFSDFVLVIVFCIKCVKLLAGLFAVQKFITQRCFN